MRWRQIILLSLAGTAILSLVLPEVRVATHALSSVVLTGLALTSSTTTQLFKPLTASNVGDVSFDLSAAYSTNYLRPTIGFLEKCAALYFGNNECQLYDRSSIVEVDRLDGYKSLQIKGTVTEKPGGCKKAISGKMSTTTPQLFEVLVLSFRYCGQAGGWAAVWDLSHAWQIDPAGPWPQDCEVDFLECVTKADGTTRCFAAIHTPENHGGNAIVINFPDQDYCTDSHTIIVRKDKASRRLSFQMDDGDVQFSPQLSVRDMNLILGPRVLMFNLALGGVLPGMFDLDQIDDSNFFIDGLNTFSFRNPEDGPDPESLVDARDIFTAASCSCGNGGTGDNWCPADSGVDTCCSLTDPTAMQYSPGEVTDTWGLRIDADQPFNQDFDYLTTVTIDSNVDAPVDCVFKLQKIDQYFGDYHTYDVALEAGSTTQVMGCFESEYAQPNDNPPRIEVMCYNSPSNPITAFTVETASFAAGTQCSGEAVEDGMYYAWTQSFNQYVEQPGLFQQGANRPEYVKNGLDTTISAVLSAPCSQVSTCRLKAVLASDPTQETYDGQYHGVASSTASGEAYCEVSFPALLDQYNPSIMQESMIACDDQGQEPSSFQINSIRVCRSDAR